MLEAILLALIMAAVLSVGSSRNALSTSLDLSQFQWKNRFLFAPNRNHPLFDTLHKVLLTMKAEVADRDLVIFEILEYGPSSMNTEFIDPQSAQSLREKFDVPQGEFAVILVGKDGGIKMKRQEQTDLEDILGLIDALPMRQKEMRQKK